MTAEGPCGTESSSVHFTPSRAPMACPAGAQHYNGPDHPYIDQPSLLDLVAREAGPEDHVQAQCFSSGRAKNRCIGSC